MKNLTALTTTMNKLFPTTPAPPARGLRALAQLGGPFTPQVTFQPVRGVEVTIDPERTTISIPTTRNTLIAVGIALAFVAVAKHNGWL